METKDLTREQLIVEINRLQTLNDYLSDENEHLKKKINALKAFIKGLTEILDLHLPC